MTTTNNNKFKLALLSLLALTLVNCKEMEPVGMVSSESGSLATGEQRQPAGDQVDPELENSMQKLDGDMDNMELDFVSIEKELDDISFLSLSAQANSSGFSSKLDISKKLKEKLWKLLDKLHKAADKLDDLEMKILAKIAKIDPIAQVLLHDKLQKLLDKIKMIKGRAGQLVDVIEDKVDIIIDRVDDIVAKKLDMSNPLHLVINIYIQKVRQVLVDFKEELAKL